MGSLIDERGSLICDLKSKADVFSQFFDGKQCRGKISVPISCYPKPELTSVVFRSRRLRKISAVLDEYGGIKPYGIFPMFSEKTCKEIFPKLAVVFHLLIKRGSFPWCWRWVGIVRLSKKPSDAMRSKKPSYIFYAHFVQSLWKDYCLAPLPGLWSKGLSIKVPIYLF